MKTKTLFLDSQAIQFQGGLRRVFHSPAKHPVPVLAPEKPWESGGVRVDRPPLWDERRGLWRMVYSGGPGLRPMLAESADGIEWVRPGLGRARTPDGQDTNLIEDCDNPDSTGAVGGLFTEDTITGDRHFPYKGFVLHRDPKKGLRLLPHASKNLFDWQSLDCDPIESEDTKYVLTDPLSKSFVAMVKGLHGYGVTSHPVPELGRSVYLTQSKDFQRWTAPELVFWGDQIDQEIGAQRIAGLFEDNNRRRPLTNIPAQYLTDIYWMPVFIYEGLYLGLPVYFHQSGQYFSRDGKLKNQDGINLPGLTLSRNLRDWDRLERRPFLPLSPLDVDGLFDYGQIYANPPVRIGNELFFYYHGHRSTHLNLEILDEHPPQPRSEGPAHAVFLARMRLDGFASLRAGVEGGLLVTKPLRVEGEKLFLNADAARGEIRVEIRDAPTGRAIPGFSLGDFLGDRALHSRDGKFGALRKGAGARFEDDPHEDDTAPVSADSTRIPVSWKSKSAVEELRGREVRLAIHLRNADLFSLWFE